MRRVTLIEEGSRLSIRALVAERFLDRFFGLLLSPPPAPGEGLLIRNCRMVHMFFMRYPIDVVFLDDSNTIIGLETRLRPFRISKSYSGASSALELRVDGATDLRVGMKFMLTDN